MLELCVASAKPRVEAVLDGIDGLPLDDEGRIASALPIGAALL